MWRETSASAAGFSAFGATLASLGGSIRHALHVVALVGPKDGACCFGQVLVIYPVVLLVLGVHAVRRRREGGPWRRTGRLVAVALWAVLTPALVAWDDAQDGKAERPQRIFSDYFGFDARSSTRFARSDYYRRFDCRDVQLEFFADPETIARIVSDGAIAWSPTKDAGVWFRGDRRPFDCPPSWRTFESEWHLEGENHRASLCVDDDSGRVVFGDSAIW